MKLRNLLAVLLVAVVVGGASFSLAAEGKCCGSDKCKAKIEKCECGKADCEKCKAAAASKGKCGGKSAKGGCSKCEKGAV